MTRETLFNDVRFETLLAVEEEPRTGRWTVFRPLRISYQNSRIEVPAGFVSDGPSIPNFSRSFVPITGRKFPPSVIHDYAIREKKWKREWADDLFFHLLLAKGVSPVQAWLMWFAVASYTTWLDLTKGFQE